MPALLCWLKLKSLQGSLFPFYLPLILLSLPWGSQTETLLDPFHLADFLLLAVVLEGGRVREDLKCI